jgi:hypothetical protein
MPCNAVFLIAEALSFRFEKGRREKTKRQEKEKDEGLPAR